jgi:Zn-dependent protease with chaperone function
MNTKMRLSEKLKASHPHVAYRIEQLEYLEDLQYEN